ncbi:hypothetical protein T4B_3985 [Trichinella pseudospiralis]|uniref:Uncharacterized protein n=1 Tax=Trichinella pseudospiralis TaxID=6337 RepID=A0A0V1JWK7_TRIPS|nr:hypothetical protein T4B_3985 [Trichinella pseudospiralis]KRZ39356.1 hypothetical protein T4C_5626 [Trichinella pseudospiralis]
MDLVSTIADRRYAVRVQWRSLSDEDHGITVKTALLLLFSVSDHDNNVLLREQQKREQAMESEMSIYKTDTFYNCIKTIRRRMKKRMTRSRVEKKPNEESSMGLYSAGLFNFKTPIFYSTVFKNMHNEKATINGRDGCEHFIVEITEVTTAHCCYI